MTVGRFFRLISHLPHVDCLSAVVGAANFSYDFFELLLGEPAVMRETQRAHAAETQDLIVQFVTFSLSRVEMVVTVNEDGDAAGVHEKVVGGEHVFAVLLKVSSQLEPVFQECA